MLNKLPRWVYPFSNRVVSATSGQFGVQNTPLLYNYLNLNGNHVDGVELSESRIEC
jgi:hypothetical protein